MNDAEPTFYFIKLYEMNNGWFKFRNSKKFSINVASTYTYAYSYFVVIWIHQRKKVIDEIEGFNVLVDMIVGSRYVYRFKSRKEFTNLYLKHKKNRGKFLQSIKDNLFSKEDVTYPKDINKEEEDSNLNNDCCMSFMVNRAI